MGVLTDSGELYLLIDDHSNSAPYEAAKKLAGAKAQISGKKRNAYSLLPQQRLKAFSISKNP